MARAFGSGEGIHLEVRYAQWVDSRPGQGGVEAGSAEMRRIDRQVPLDADRRDLPVDGEQMLGHLL